MSTFEVRGGTITHRYLMNKSKDDLARLYLDMHRRYTTLQQTVLDYARHTDDCQSRRGHDCDCGKDAVVAAAQDWLRG